jgi:glycerophosphoryl diester phosphodiesterase
MRILAHRGASGYAPENTFAAFDLALGMGAPVLETDVRLTHDGVPVLIHDENLDRTTNGTGPVAETDSAALAELDAGAWFDRRFAGQRVPRLDEFLDRYAAHVGLCIEIKVPAAVALVAELIAARSGPRAFVGLEFTAFEWDIVLALRGALPDVPVGLLVRQSDTHPASIDRAAEAGLAMIGPSAGAVTPEFVRAAHARGLKVRTWGVDNRDDFHRVIACGADGTTLNWPDWIRHPTVTGREG